MKTLLFLAICSGYSCLMASGSLLEFSELIGEVTGHFSLQYMAYGCHCGVGGSGQPKDATDRCCRTHDCCYEWLSGHNCYPKKNMYDFNMKENGQLTCISDTWCGLLVCKCDSRAVLCFKANRETFNWRLTTYPDWMCKGKLPPCQPSASPNPRVPQLAEATYSVDVGNYSNPGQQTAEEGYSSGLEGA